MKLCLITNKYNIFLRLYLKYVKSISKKDLIIAIEKSNYSARDKKLELSRLTNKFKEQLNSKKLPNLEEYNHIKFKSINSDEFIEFVKRQKISFILNCSIGEIVKKKYLFNKIINVHPSYLPKYRGCSCPEWTLYFGDIPAVTAHLINKRIDLGPIIRRKFIRFKFKSYKYFRSKLYLESIILGCKVLTNIYMNQGIDKKKLINQKKNDGNYYKPMPTKIFKSLKLRK